MTKTLSYSSLLLASFLVITALFVTANSYSQLAVAAIFYPAFIYVAFKIYPRRNNSHSEIKIQTLPKSTYNKVETAIPEKESFTVADIDKRVFLKLIGATGVSFFLFSLLGRRVESFLSAGTGQSKINQIGSGSQVSQSPTDGYQISEIDDNNTITYYGFTKQDSTWYIMRQDTNGNSFRYTKGKSNFPANWANRENLEYGYYHNLF